MRGYHQRTKHRLDRYAAGPETLDWDAQPDPFRRFEGAPLAMLPLGADSIATPYTELYKANTVAPAALTVASVGALLELSLGLAAWKQYGTSRWALRCNPSSGNLHPTEGYVVLPEVADPHGGAGIAAGAYHYASREHALEARCTGPAHWVASLTQALTPQSLLVGLSSVYWREAWKYGERAFRYCQLDEGHAIAAVRYAAAVLGWRASLLAHWGDEQIAAVLGLDRAQDFAGVEPEQPAAMLLLRTGPDKDPACCDAAPFVRTVGRGRWRGQANLLDPKPLYRWPLIDEVSAAARKGPTTEPDRTQAVAAVHAEAHSPCAAEAPDTMLEPAARLIRQRRSTQAFNPQVTMAAQTFYALLQRLLPAPNLPPWDALPGPARVHPVLFVHRVEGVAPGLYALVRSDTALATLRTAMRPEFDWAPPEGCPNDLPLFLLKRANCRRAAGTVSCHQAIAADAAFSLGMLAEFDDALTEGPWMYRELFWEAGVLGQALYLDAEAHGLRGTGIGCFFDDVFHDILGLADTRLQSLYHFAVGHPVIDRRLITLSPYHHLQRAHGPDEPDGGSPRGTRLDPA